MEKWEIQVIVSMIMLTRYSCTNNEAWRLARLHVRTCDVIKNALLAILPIVCRPLNIIGAWFRALLKPLGTVLLRCSRGFILYWVPMISRGAGPWSCTQRNLFEILLNQTEIGLYLPFSDWFGTKRKSVWFQINRKMISTIRFLFDLIIFWKDLSVWLEMSSQNHRINHRQIWHEYF